MSDEDKTASNQHPYAEHREMFKAVRSTLQISTTRSDDELVEHREIYLTAIPESQKLNKKFEYIEFKVLESIRAFPTDNAGTPIVGTVNSSPQPVHVVLFVTPRLLSLLSRRHMSHPRVEHSEFFITIHPATSILDWDQKKSIPIYESVFHFQG